MEYKKARTEFGPGGALYIAIGDVLDFIEATIESLYDSKAITPSGKAWSYYTGRIKQLVVLKTWLQEEADRDEAPTDQQSAATPGSVAHGERMSLTLGVPTDTTPMAIDLLHEDTARSLASLTPEHRTALRARLVRLLNIIDFDGGDTPPDTPPKLRVSEWVSCPAQSYPMVVGRYYTVSYTAGPDASQARSFQHSGTAAEDIPAGTLIKFHPGRLQFKADV